MQLRKKMSVNLSIIVAIAFLAMVLNVILLRDNSSSSTDINLLGKQRMLSQKITKELFLYNANPTAENLNQFKSTSKLFNDTLNSLLTGEPLKIGDKNIVVHQQTKDTVVAALTEVNKIWTPIYKKILDVELGDDTKILQGNLAENNLKLLKFSNVATVESATLSKAKLGKIEIISEVSFVIILCFGLYVYLFSNRQVFNNIDDVIRRAQDIADGKLTDIDKIVITNKSNEIDHLHANIEKMRQNLHDVINKLTDVTEALPPIVSLVTETTRTSNEFSRTQQNNLDSIGGQVTSISANASEISGTSENNSETSKQVTTNINNSSDIMNKTKSSIEDLAESFRNMEVNVNELKSCSDNIGSILDVIRGIAEQTNLLALNAAIEAARAGEQGRGFAVVADEVRTLAGRTQQSTEEIQDMIEKLQSSSSVVTESMGYATEKVKSGVEYSVEANTSLQAVTNDIAAINDASTEIAKSAQIQETSTHDIAARMDELTAAAGTMQDKLLDSDKAISELNALSGEIADIVSFFKVN